MLLQILKLLPRNHLSALVGKLVHIPLPRPIARWSILVFAWLYKIDPRSAVKPVEEYKSIGDFFTRDLKAELRPLAASSLVVPVDGRLRSAETINDGTLLQVKGRTYKLSDLLRSEEDARIFEGGVAWNLYLSPQDAHYIVSPCDGVITKTVHIPGTLWPVNDLSLNNIESLFAVNERIITFIRGEKGLVAVVMVGATNVGKIKLAYSEVESNSNLFSKRTKKEIVHNETISIKKGEKIGTFLMGSSVIILAENSWNAAISVPPGIVTMRTALA